MKPALAGDAPYRVPRENRRWPALTLAVAMHADWLDAMASAADVEDATIWATGSARIAVALAEHCR